MSVCVFWGGVADSWVLHCSKVVTSRANVGDTSEWKETLHVCVCLISLLYIDILYMLGHDICHKLMFTRFCGS